MSQWRRNLRLGLPVNANFTERIEHLKKSKDPKVRRDALELERKLNAMPSRQMTERESRVFRRKQALDILVSASALPPKTAQELADLIGESDEQ